MPSPHRIAQGETLIGLSETYGFSAETIWNHPDNEELRNRRKNMNVLAPGDVVVIPDKMLGQQTGGTEKRHRFRRKGVPAVLRLQLFDGEEPRANQPYVFKVGRDRRSGTTDGDGMMEEWLPPNARKAEIIVGDEELHLVVNVGRLDPIDLLSGVRQRLSNLGYACSAGSGEMDESTRDALERFQRRFGLEVTGEPDAATLDQLASVHDRPNEFPEEG